MTQPQFQEPKFQPTQKRRENQARQQFFVAFRWTEPFWSVFFQQKMRCGQNHHAEQDAEDEENDYHDLQGQMRHQMSQATIFAAIKCQHNRTT